MGSGRRRMRMQTHSRARDISIALNFHSFGRFLNLPFMCAFEDHRQHGEADAMVAEDALAEPEGTGHDRRKRRGTKAKSLASCKFTELVE